MSLRVVTWNVMHGRSVPPAGRDLFDEFAAALQSWEWDVALLQEVPPWWPARLAPHLEAHYELALTSRNLGPATRRAIARRWPDLIKSNGGGCNATLVRNATVTGSRTKRLSTLPERRQLLATSIEVADTPSWIGNVHLNGWPPQAAHSEARRAAAAIQTWAGNRPVVLGGDFNTRRLFIDGLKHAGGYSVDHLFARGLVAVTDAEVLDRGTLSDHAPVAVTFTPPRPRA